MLDMHCHIDLYENPLSVAKGAERASITVLAVTNLPSHYEMAVRHLRGLKMVNAALGFHPLMAAEHKAEVSIFRRMVREARFVGEIGLDFRRQDATSRDVQIACFSSLLEELQDRPRLISVHSRGAEACVLRMLGEAHIERVIFHWYSGPLSVLDEAIDAGHYFSVNPAMLISQNGKRIVERIPNERILTETDGPYVTVAGRRATPADVKIVLDRLGLLWSVPLETAEKQVTANYDDLMSHIG